VRGRSHERRTVGEPSSAFAFDAGGVVVCDPASKAVAEDFWRTAAVFRVETTHITLAYAGAPVRAVAGPTDGHQSGRRARTGVPHAATVEQIRGMLTTLTPPYQTREAKTMHKLKSW